MQVFYISLKYDNNNNFTSVQVAWTMILELEKLIQRKEWGEIVANSVFPKHIFNRPGVAGDVLQAASSFIN